MRLLFVCGRNRLRSPTAEQVFSGITGIEPMSAGVSRDADDPLTAELIEWADVIFVMEQSHGAKMAQAFPKSLRGKRVVCLGIPDKYDYMNAALVRLLWDRVPRSVPALLTARPAWSPAVK